jgi:hypothetical protein
MRKTLFQIDISQIFLSQHKIVKYSDLSTQTVALSTRVFGKLPQGCNSTLTFRHRASYI